MTVEVFAGLPEIEIVTLPDGGRNVSCGYIGDLLSWVMGKAPADSIWMTIMSNINICAVASLADVSCILLVEGVTVDDRIRQVANEKGINILRTSLDAYTAAGLLKEQLS